MRVLIAGAAGMLGQDVADACRARDHEVFPLSRSELDVTDVNGVERALGSIKPDAVLNCAAWTDVDGAEANEAAALLINDLGAGLVASATASRGIKVAYVSSDYVFDGTKGSGYVESDLPHPISAYGRSKLAGETSTAAANSRSFVVRSSWLFGARGGNFVETMLRLAREQGEVIVVSDQVGAPTYTRHLAQALAMLVETDDFGVHHVAASGSCSWFEFAQEIFDQAHSDCRVMSGTTEMLGRPAPRPANSVLASEHPDAFVLPLWRDALGEYLIEREKVPA